MMAEALKRELFGEGAGGVFAVLDGASVPELLDKLHEHRPQYECLFRGDLKPDMAEVAPYLVRLEPDAAFTEWILEQGWGRHWGIFLASGADVSSLRLHFRRFLIVYDPNGKPLYFRFYDPRVLRAYLPTCNGEQLQELFGPVSCFLAEGERPEILLRFKLEGGRLASTSTALGSEVKM